MKLLGDPWKIGGNYLPVLELNKPDYTLEKMVIPGDECQSDFSFPCHRITII